MTNRLWSLDRGATVMDGGVRFSVWAPHLVWAPHPKTVAVRLLDEWGNAVADHALEARGGGVFERFVPGVAPGAEYQYVLGGDQALPDPVSRAQPRGVHGPSCVVDPGAFQWTDAGWVGIEMADYVIYELHVGTFSDEGTFDGAIPYLSELKELGVTAVEVMPVAEFPGGRNWGYDGVHPYAAQSTYGGPAGLRRLVDAAHAAGLAVVLDVVYNHLGPEGNYLEAYGPYFTDTYRTPWGRAVNYDGPHSDEVRRYAIDNALFWVTEYHVDALRLDAIHGIFDSGAEHVLQVLTTRVHEQAAALGRTVQVIAESDLNDPKVIRPAAQHGYGFDAQWSDDFHHAVHSALTGETGGYYADFGGIGSVAATLDDPFLYNGRYSPHRQRRHGGATAGLSRDRFVVCIQNHDQVGNRAAGERLGALVPPDRQRLAAALLLLSPYVPLLFMGEEYGETNPFQYFISHTDPALVEAVRNGRRAEFASFGWRNDVPDPQAEETFLRSKLDRAKALHAAHAGIYALYCDLLWLRKEEPALRPGDAEWRVGHDAAAGWVTLALTHASGRSLFAAFNLSGGQLCVTPPAGDWSPVLSTDEARYGGCGGPHHPTSTAAERARSRESHGSHGSGGSRLGGAALPVPPYVAVLYRKEND